MGTLISIEKLGIGLSTAKSVREVTPFKPIGIGKPLIVRIHTLYPGIIEKGLLTGGEKSILVTTRIKDDITSDVPQRSLNHVFKDVKSGKALYATAATQGTELVYYTRAFVDKKLKFNIDIKLDKFNEKMLKDIGGLLSKAAGLPVFAMHAPFVLIGGKLLSLSGDFLNKILNKDSLLTYDFDIYDDIGGLPDSQSGWYIGANKEEMSYFKGCDITVDEGGNTYLAKDGKEYNGEYPYILCSIDGLKVKRYEGFKLAHASSSLLEQFYGKQEDEKNFKVIEDMISLYNDYEYVKKIRDTEKSMDNNSDEEKEKSQTLIEAYKANIENEDLRKILGS
jgi:hypothetical protein